MKKILVTGAAGFIGFHVSKYLCERGDKVVGLDNLNDYYDVSLKKARLIQLEPCSSFRFLKMDISNRVEVENLFEAEGFDCVVHLAAQAGVRYSLKNPEAYINSNLVGFANILECCREADIEHLLFASSSSVYGMNVKQPFSAQDNTDFPVSLYAATKKANELLAHSYSHLFGFACTGLRFFTVYGPYGRPDMAYYKFTENIFNGKAIDVFNDGQMERDFTYIDDIVNGIIALIDQKPMRTSNSISNAPSSLSIYNLGNNNPITLKRFISAIENALDKKADKNYLPMQPGDVPITYADIDPLVSLSGFEPKTSIEDGIKKFVDWYLHSKKDSK